MHPQCWYIACKSNVHSGIYLSHLCDDLSFVPALFTARLLLLLELWEFSNCSLVRESDCVSSVLWNTMKHVLWDKKSSIFVNELSVLEYRVFSDAVGCRVVFTSIRMSWLMVFLKSILWLGYCYLLDPWLLRNTSKFYCGEFVWFSYISVNFCFICF